MSDIIDEIDALVDWQLDQEASGYDHNVNQARCRCGRDWHGLPITKRIDGMRSYGEFDPGYTFAEDDSPVMCVGSNTPGPWRQVGLWQLPDDPFGDSWGFRSAANWFVEIGNGRAYSLAALSEMREHFASIRTFPETISDGAPYRYSGISVRRGSDLGWAIFDELDIPVDQEPEVEPDTRTPQQRALPRPSTTAPMWAHDVNRSRRPKRRRGQPNRQGIA